MIYIVETAFLKTSNDLDRLEDIGLNQGTCAMDLRSTLATSMPLVSEKDRDFDINLLLQQEPAV